MAKKAADASAKVPGSNPPREGEDQNVREAGMLDIVDAAQNQMPGTPQTVITGRRQGVSAPAEAPRPEKGGKR